MTKEEIGKILKTAREQAGYTQSQVAHMLGRRQQVIGNWETGYAQPDANTLFELCDIYRISVDATFGKKKISDERRWHMPLDEAYKKADKPTREAVCRVLNIDYIEPNGRATAKKEETVRVFMAARSSDNTPPGYVDIPRSILDKLDEMPTVDSDDEI